MNPPITTPPPVPTTPELTFDPTWHSYKLKGRPIPSVSKLMRPLSNAYYGKIDEEILKAAAARGTAVHQAIETYLQYKFDDIEEELLPYYTAFKAWHAKHNPTVHAIEHRIYHKIYHYAGTADLICELDGKLTIVDFKTSATIVDMLTKVQLHAYTSAYLSHDYPIKSRAVVHLKKDGTYKMTAYDNTDLDEVETFSALLTIHNYIKKETKK
ncbi:MAG: PD-(D/E)XK nuclease family protein [Turicibacter sp.]|nr:PD-(D/E)XK nuclease family protein [Turicibacter sp.]